MMSDMHERGVAFGTAFVDLFATAIYGHELAPGGEEVIADRFIADVADLRVKFARDGISPAQIDLWARGALQGFMGRIVTLKGMAGAMGGIAVN